MTRHVRIFDTTLRDGEQSPGASMNVEEKVLVAKQLARLNVDVIEAGFAMSSPGDFEAVQRIGREVEGPTICSLARARPEDVDAAANALKGAPKPRIHTFLSASDIHLVHQFHMTRDQALTRAVEMVRHARGYVDDVEYSPMDATRSDVSYLCEVVEAVIDAGAGTVNIPDTVGYTTPQEFGEIIRTLRGPAFVTVTERSFRSIATMILGWPWPIRWRRFTRGPDKWNVPSMESANGRAMRHWRKS